MQETAVISPRTAVTVSREDVHDHLSPLMRLVPRLVVPSACQFIHEPWSWWRARFFAVSYAEFSRWIAEHLPASEVLCLYPGVGIRLSAAGYDPLPHVKWLAILGECGGDYEFDALASPPSTASIAHHFPDSSTMRQRVYHYCEFELLSRYCSALASARCRTCRVRSGPSAARRWRIPITTRSSV